MTLTELNRLPDSRAEGEFARCCGSQRWSRLMASERPFASADVLSAAAERLWWSLEAVDWLEAFAAHPRIGEAATSAWSNEEQHGVKSADAGVRERLAAMNREYEKRFGYTFLVCATGKSATDVVDILERRLHNEPGDELQVAAAEQRLITELRLKKLLST